MAITKVSRGLLNTGISDSSDATAITIDGSENITVVGSFTIDTGTNGVPIINLSHSNANADNFRIQSGIAGVANSGMSIRDVDASANRLTIDSSGNVSVVGGNLVIGTSGKGIDFSSTGDGNATMSSELFDDYEEGTFTPVYTSTGLSVTHDIQNGLYTKVGDTVHFWILLGTDAVSGTGSSILQITGLPYTCKNTASSFVSGAVGLAYTFASNEQNMKWFLGSNTSLIALYDGDSNVGGVFPSSKLGTTSNDNRLYISGSYKTD